MALVWGVLWALTGRGALPGGNFFALLMLLVFGYIGGVAVRLIKLPPLLGEYSWALYIYQTVIFFANVKEQTCLLEYTQIYTSPPPMPDIICECFLSFFYLGAKVIICDTICEKGP